MPSSEFKQLVHSLSKEALCSLVADIWTARGWETTACGGVVVAHDPDQGETRTIAVACGDETFPDLPSSDLSNVDVLVTPTDRQHIREASDRHDVRYVGPDDLHTMLLYAINRDVGESLFRQHFDRQPVHREPRRRLDGSDESPSGPMESIARNRPIQSARGDRADRDDGSTSPGTGTVERNGDHERGGGTSDQGNGHGGQGPEMPANRGFPFTGAKIPPSDIEVALVVIVIALLLLAMGTVFGDAPRATDGGESPERLSVTVPPGLSTDEITSVTVLARTHEAGITDQSYRLRIRHDGSRGSLVTGSRWISTEQAVRVDGEDGYLFRVEGTLPPKTVGGATRRVEFVEYANGSTCYRHPDPSYVDETAKPNECPPNVANETTDRFAEMTARYILRFLDTTRSRVEPTRIEGQYRYRVIATGTPYRINRAVEDYVATAVVDRTGVVRRLQVRYTYRSSDGQETVRFEYSYSAIGEATVSSPDWTGTEGINVSTSTESRDRRVTIVTAFERPDRPRTN